VYSLPQAAFTPNTTISSAAVNSDLSDIAAQLTNSLAADGQTTMTGAVKAQSGTSSSPGYAFASDTATGLYLAGSGIVGLAGANGAVIPGVSAGSAAATGVVGEYLKSLVPTSPGISVNNFFATATQITTLTLSAGDWDVWGEVTFQEPGTASNIQVAFQGWLTLGR
jgi:hypothetical protein